MVSIHTLTRRVTKRSAQKSRVDGVSIHTLTRRVTELSRKPFCLLQVSIHTLTRRVTAGRGAIVRAILSFNPHPHAEGD